MITDRLTIAAIFLAMAVPAAFPVALAAHEADPYSYNRMEPFCRADFAGKSEFLPESTVIATAINGKTSTHAC